MEKIMLKSTLLKSTVLRSLTSVRFFTDSTMAQVFMSGSHITPIVALMSVLDAGVMV